MKLSVAENIRLDRFQSLYGAILRNCVCGRLMEAYDNSYDPGEANGWTWIIEDWIKHHLEIERKSGIDPNSVGTRDRTLSACDMLLGVQRGRRLRRRDHLRIVFLRPVG